MKKAIVIMSVIVTIGCIISIGGAYAATNYAISASKIGYADNSSLGVDNVQAAIDGTCTKFSNQLTNLKKDVINEMYPEGSIYITTELTTKKDVEGKFGGTWESYGAGKTLVGIDTSDTSFNTVGKTSGSKLNSTTLTVANLPSHSHDITHTHDIDEKTYTTNTVSLTGEFVFHGTPTSSPVMQTTGVFSSKQTLSQYSNNNVASGATSVGIVGIDVSHNHTVTVAKHSTNKPSSTQSGTTGKNTAFTTSTLQPYIVVYMWRRTA